MRSFSYLRATAPEAAVTSATVEEVARTAYLGGGTTLIDLMKLDVMRPERLVDITGLDMSHYGRVEKTSSGLRIGALARMADVAEDATVRRDYPVLAQSLALAASPQLRYMARVGGNVLQRTRCNYFRDTTYAQCNKRIPGSGCAAMDGYNRSHAVLGTSEDCIATYPGDWAQALMALDVRVELLGRSGPRKIRFADLHRAPGRTPHIETTLQPGDLITGFFVDGPWPRSRYVKVRDRESYQFALASAAVALDLDGPRVREARIALGGIATVPWRARTAEGVLTGNLLDETSATAAAELAFEDAQTRTHNAYKVPLGKATLVRALLEAARMEV